MKRKQAFRMLASWSLIAVFAGSLALTGCTKRPNKEELSSLDEACNAAKSAEQKLDDLKQERMTLESEFESKKSELSELETQRDAIKVKLEETITEEPVSDEIIE